MKLIWGRWLSDKVFLFSKEFWVEWTRQRKKNLFFCTNYLSKLHFSRELYLVSSIAFSIFHNWNIFFSTLSFLLVCKITKKYKCGQSIQHVIENPPHALPQMLSISPRCSDLFCLAFKFKVSYIDSYMLKIWKIV